MRMTLRFLPDLDGITSACELLDQGNLVAFPTETVYGLGADAANPRAIAANYAAKGRPAFNPLIAHVADLAMAERQGVFNAAARTLADTFWPGPLTLVVPATPDTEVCDLARAGLASVGLRCPSHPLALALISAFGRPICGPSANRSGHVSPTRAEHVLGDLTGRIAAVIDAGPCSVGIESTIVGCFDAGTYLLRPGVITRDEIEAAIGGKLAEKPADESGKPMSPGQLTAHYAPATPVRLSAVSVAPDEVLLAFGPDALPGQAEARQVFNLSEAGDLTEAAARLYEGLRALDQIGGKSIAVAAIPPQGLGEAIMDRLQRAAAGSPIFSE